nr:AEC family transporter [Ramlibacter agri]
MTGPIYAIVAVGWLCTRYGLFDRTDMRVFGKYVVNLALPALLFTAIAQRRFGEVLQPVFLAAYGLGSLASLLLGLLWARRVARKRVSASAIAGLGMACPNSSFIGFPVVAQVFGPTVAGIGLAMALLVENFFTIPLALAIADSDGGGEGSVDAALRRSLRSISRNPMIWGIVAGFVFSFFRWELPEPVARTVNLFATACGSLSLFVIGGSLAGIRIHGPVARDAGVVAIGKLLVHPLAVLCLVLLLPPMERQLQLAVVVMAAVPMMGIYPILAQKYGHDTDAAAAQLGTTVASFFTLTALLWVVQHFWA